MQPHSKWAQSELARHEQYRAGLMQLAAVQAQRSAQWQVWLSDRA